MRHPAASYQAILNLNELPRRPNLAQDQDVIEAKTENHAEITLTRLATNMQRPWKPLAVSAARCWPSDSNLAAVLKSVAVFTKNLAQSDRFNPRRVPPPTPTVHQQSAPVPLLEVYVLDPSMPVADTVRKQSTILVQPVALRNPKFLGPRTRAMTPAAPKRSNRIPRERPRKCLQT